jgi:hypothetical protein
MLVSPAPDPSGSIVPSLFREDGAANPAFLKLDLFCKGLRIDASCELAEDARDIIRNRAGLGSGLEVVIGRDMHANVPVVEWWVQASPYVLCKQEGRYEVRLDLERLPEGARDAKGFDRSVYAGLDRSPAAANRGPFPAALDRSRSLFVDHVAVPREPEWYKRRTSSGKLMQRIGCLQGTYLGIYWGPRCQNWGPNGENEFCKFCTEGQNLGREEETEKSILDVLETVKAARQESRITFVHFNTGFLDSNDYWGLFHEVVRRVKEETGLLVGVQAPPDANFENYRRFKKLGVNNISFCFEVLDPERFVEIGPGKARRAGLQRYLDAIEFCAGEVGFDTVNGEIIAGLESTQSSLRAIDWIVAHNAIPTVCVFRPVAGAAYGRLDPPAVEEMLPVFGHFYDAVMERGLPVGIAPNVKVSLIMLPEECRELSPRCGGFKLARTKLWALRTLFGAWFNATVKG